jgi:hypothetical protein
MSCSGAIKSSLQRFQYFQYARNFYISQWYRDATVEVEKKIKASGDDGEFDETEEEMTTENMANQEKRKKFMMSQIDCSQPTDLNFISTHGEINLIQLYAVKSIAVRQWVCPGSSVCSTKKIANQITNVYHVLKFYI